MLALFSVGGWHQEAPMSLRHSVRSIERQLRRGGTCGVCGVCGGRGWPCTIVVRDGVPSRPPRGCSACGKVSLVKKIILDRRPAPGAAS